MRILDADILAYALYDMSPAHTVAWGYLETHLKHGNKLYITPTTILETYNTLYWYYKIRPMKDLLEKLTRTMEVLEVVTTSTIGPYLATKENIPLGDGFLLATAQEHNIPIIVSNDQHIEKTCKKLGLINENPVTDEIRELLSNS
jgi:predicted nucleic acid-binding protein